MTCLVPAIATGVLLCLCFQPLSWGWLAWVALVPMLTLVRSQAKPRTIYFAAWVAGTVFFWPTLSWMAVADKWMLGDDNLITAILHLRPLPMHGAYALLAYYCSLYFPAAIFGIRWLEQRTRWPLVVTAPIIWVSLEFVRSFALTGFAWYYMGHTQHIFLPIVQITDLAGAYAVSLLVVAVNALVFDWAYQFADFRGWFRQESLMPDETAPRAGRLVLQTLCLAMLVGASLGYGYWRLGQDRFRDGPVLSMLQGNIDQRLRNEASDPTQAMEKAQQFSRDIVSHYVDLAERARNQRPAPDLLIWPETSYPHAWYEISSDLPIADIPVRWRETEAEMRRHYGKIGEMTRTNHLIGTGTNFLDANGKHRAFNSAVLVSKSGAVSGRYDKMHRVPFGEYVPFRDWLPFMKWLSPYDFDYSISSGERFQRFKLDKLQFGVLICFEDTDPFLARRYVQNGADGSPVDFLVNISNDGWFDGSSEHAEHLAISRFRAIECRRSIARAVNMGISAIIDPNGRVLKPMRVAAKSDKTGPETWAVQTENGQFADWPISDWRSLCQTQCVLTASIPIDDRFSLYATLGDWLPMLCCCICVGLLFPTRWLRKHHDVVNPKR